MERARKQADTTPRSGTVVDARMSLALWLRAGRAEKGMSLEDVARVTKIQTRILERLEAGKLDGLPADVFVRGFIRSFAKCCGLAESEALARYAAAAEAQATATAPAMPNVLVGPTARAMVDVVSELAPKAASAVKEPEVIFAAGSLASIELPAAEPAKKPKKKQRGKKRANRATKPPRLAAGTPHVPTPVVVERIDIAAAEPAVVEAAPVVEEPPVEEAPALVEQIDPLVTVPVEEDIVATDPWQPRFDKVPTASVPWRRPYVATTTTSPAVPTLVIDDADPESAASVLEDREAEKASQRRSFLPPILLDREDRSARQGGLTLAVIILLIAATLTLSYLMRRPSSSGDGVTTRATETQRIG